MYTLLYILWYAFWAYIIYRAIKTIVETLRWTPEDQAKFVKEEQQKIQARKRRQRLQDPNTRTLNNIYWLTFFNSIFKKK